MTENYLRLGLLFIAGSILFLILFEAWHKRRHLRMMKTFDLPAAESNPVDNSFFVEHKEEPRIAVEPVSKAELSNDLLMISILAKPGCQFASYDLLQAILSAGFQFGDMNLFHYHLPAQKGGAKLFSLASTTKSGEFNLDYIGDFSCKGLILFLDLNAVLEPKKAFDLMLIAAEQLAEDLDGDLRADPHTPWNVEVHDQYQRKISEKAL